MTPNKEDYLKCIYEISTHAGKITNKEIAARMQVSPPAVTEMVKKLLIDQVIIKDKEAGYLLTQEGQLLVAQLYRKHRLIEVFLLEHLNYTTDEIHEEAEVLEHTVSDLFIDRIDQLLDFPKYCPHGGSIPQANGTLLETHTQTLDKVKENGIYKLTRVHDEFQLLKYLEQHQIKLGDELHILDYDPYTQVYTVQVGQQTLQINPVIAQQLYIEKRSG